MRSDPSTADYVSLAPRLGRTAKPKIALVHEWLYTYAGAEKVLEVMLAEFPDADVFSLIDRMPQRHRAGLRGKPIRTTILQKIPFVEHIYKRLLPLMPYAIEQLDLSQYDLIISNSHAVSKGVLTSARQLHICYCYTPMRYAWDLQEQYLQRIRYRPRCSRVSWRAISCTVSGCGTMRARSASITSLPVLTTSPAGSRRPTDGTSTVIYPERRHQPVRDGRRPRGFLRLLLADGALQEDAPHRAGLRRRCPTSRLVMIGTGPQFNRIKKLATPNVTLLGYQPFPVLLDHLQRARAFIFAAEEDFGIAPVEAQACGTPVLAFGRGGAQETVIDGSTGLHFHEQTPEAIRDVVMRFEALETPLDPHVIRRHALRFSTDRFQREFSTFVRSHWERHAAEMAPESERSLERYDDAA